MMEKLKKRLFFTVVLSAGLLLWGCEGGGLLIEEKPLCDPPHANQSIVGTWKVVKLEFNGELSDSVFIPLGIGGFYREILIVIPDTLGGSVCGHSLMNFVWAEYEVKAGRQIRFMNYNRTPFPEESEVISATFGEKLQGITAYCFSNSNLVFINDEGRPIIVLEKVSEAKDLCDTKKSCEPQTHAEISCTQDILNNAWKVVKQNISGELICVSSIPQTVIQYSYHGPYLNFTNSLIGGASGGTGINQLSTSYEIDDQQIIFKSVHTITRAVDHGWGMAFKENLLNTSRYCTSNDHLYFFNADGQATVVFIKK